MSGGCASLQALADVAIHTGKSDAYRKDRYDASPHCSTGKLLQDIRIGECISEPPKL